MSRVGKYPIKLPAGVTASVDKQTVTVQGKLGTLKAEVSDLLSVTVEDNALVVKPLSQTKQARALWGTTRANLHNMVVGVSEGFKRKLELIGVGYKAQATGKGVKLSLGYSHDIDYIAPEGVKITCPDITQLEISGIDKRAVGAAAAKIRSYREPEPYKGKGVKYDDETVLRKEGKKK